MRTLIGLAIGIVLFVIGVPVLTAVVHQWGLFTNFGYDQAVMAFILILACVVAAQLTGLRYPKDKP